jgi:phage terminase large subunit-like protein
MSKSSQSKKRDFCAIARQYCEDVLSGNILACKWVKLACERQVNDLQRIGQQPWLYEFDEEKASRICRFIERLPHIKGPLAGKTITLEPWQVFILTTVFGWVKKSTKARRFRKVYIEVPKGNGKSALSSGVALYMLAADGEGGAEIYSAARVKEQARWVFDVACAMLRQDVALKLRDSLGIEVLTNVINQQKTESKFKPLASEAQSFEGINPHFACLDELHAHRTREVHDNIQTALPKRVQNLMWSITTAGTNKAGICFELHTYVQRVLDRKATDETYFGVIYTVDDEEKLPDGTVKPGDDWTDPRTWQKANPNYEVSVFSEVLASDCNMAMQNASSKPTFLTKNLNVWVNADTSWLDAKQVEACIDRSLDESQFENEDAYIGVDLASKIDLCAKVKVFTKQMDTQVEEKHEDGTKELVTKKLPHYYAFGTYWVPEVQADKAENAHYLNWIDEGQLIAVPGEVTDHNEIERTIREDCGRFTVKEVDHDPFQATQMMNSLMEDSITCVDVPRNVKFFSPTMKELEAMVAAKRFHFNGDGVLKWALNNVICHRDANDNVFPRKQRNENKIDPAIALLMAFGRCALFNDPNEGGSVYDKRGILTL